MVHYYMWIASLLALTAITSCDDDPITPVPIPVPETYVFERNGASSVVYQGQIDRLNQLSEIKSELLSVGDNRGIVQEADLLDAYANTNGNGNGLFSFTSTKQLKSKTFAPDLDDQMFEKMFKSLAEASVEANGGSKGADGQAGLIIREEISKTILIDANGREFTQLIEKGLMGAVFYHQIYNVYLTEERVGDNVENTKLEDGTNYTEMEHHWDEAFGYWAAPLDYESPWPSDRNGETRFWSKYSNTVDDVLNGQLGTNQTIMDAFKTGRTAIVNKDYATKNAQREILYDQLDLVAAATTVHYINSTISQLSSGFIGEALHTLTEAWAFANALKYNPNRRLQLEDIEQIKETDFGADGNFWNASAYSLNMAKAKIIAAYPELHDIQDLL